MMKYFFHTILLVDIVSVLANSNLTTKPAKNDNETKKASQCNVNNNNYNFYAGPNSKKLGNMISEVKQQLVDLKKEIREIKENQTGGPGGKADNSMANTSRCNVINYSSFLPNHTKRIERMFSEVNQQLTELREEIKDMKENQTGGLCGKVYKNCADVYTHKTGGKISGVYKINPDGLSEFKVFCDQKTAGGGWTVFQKRRDGSVDFFRAWDDYKRGFGNLSGEFWLGLDRIHRLTISSRNKLRVDLEDVPGKTAFAEYSSFAVANETSKYRLSLGSYSGTAGDSLGPDRGAAFSTKDRDNDIFSSYNCVLIHKSAWWHNVCHYSNLNGEYRPGLVTTNGVTWYHWKSQYYSVKRSEMKIRPEDF